MFRNSSFVFHNVANDATNNVITTTTGLIFEIRKEKACPTLLNEPPSKPYPSTFVFIANFMLSSNPGICFIYVFVSPSLKFPRLKTFSKPNIASFVSFKPSATLAKSFVTLENTIKLGPIAATINPHLIIWSFCSSDKPLNFSTSSVMFSANFRIIGVNLSPIEINADSTALFNSVKAPFKLSFMVSAMS